MLSGTEMMLSGSTSVHVGLVAALPQRELEDGTDRAEVI